MRIRKNKQAELIKKLTLNGKLSRGAVRLIMANHLLPILAIGRSPMLWEAVEACRKYGYKISGDDFSCINLLAPEALLPTYK